MVGKIRPYGNYALPTFWIYKDMPPDSMNNEPGAFNTTHEHEIFGDRDFPSWLTQQQISLACAQWGFSARRNAFI